MLFFPAFFGFPRGFFFSRAGRVTALTILSWQYHIVQMFKLFVIDYVNPDIIFDKFMIYHYTKCQISEPLHFCLRAGSLCGASLYAVHRG